MATPRKTVEKLDAPVWYSAHQSDTVIVFVHGFLSNNVACWQAASAYWPDLVLEDARFEQPAVMLGGFETKPSSRDFGIADAAQSLFTALQRQDERGRTAAWERGQLIFVCHSTGGIVVRYMLSERAEAFRSKQVGLALIASPSLGSRFSDVAWPLLRLLGLRLGEQLAWRSEILQDLDRRFFRLVEGELRLARLHGIEGIEHQPIFPAWIPAVMRTLAPGWLRVVEPSSGRRYFSDWRRLENTDHFSAAKPSTLNHPSHLLLHDLLMVMKRAATSESSELPTFLGSREVPTTEVNRLFFGARAHTFVGRGSELLRLRDFLASSARFCWWLVTGPAGSGKSRIALELCRQVEKSWHAGFLLRAVYDEEWNFRPVRPTLIVVDYVAGREDDVHRMLRELSERRTTFAHPVRILVLERDSSTQVIERMLGVGGDRHILEATKFDSSDLALPKIGTDDLCRIARELKGGTSGAEEPLVEAMERLADGRPLIAALLGEGLTEHSRNALTSREGLLRSYLRREAQSRWVPFGVDEQYRNMLALATAFDGLDISSAFQNPRLAELIPPRKRYNPEILAAAIGVEATATVAALRPALIGEFFVLEHLRPQHAADQERVESWRRLLWKHFDRTQTFLLRCHQDFPDDEVVGRLIEAPPNAGREAIEWSAFMLQATLLRDLGQKSWANGERQLAQLDRVVGDKPQEESIANNLRTLAHLWWASAEAAQGKMPEALARVERWTGQRLSAASLRESRWMLDAMYVCPISAVLTELTTAWAQAKRPSEMMDSFGCLLEMASLSEYREPLDQTIEAVFTVSGALKNNDIDFDLDVLVGVYSRLRDLSQDYYKRRGLLVQPPDAHGPPSQFERSLSFLAAGILVRAAQKRELPVVRFAASELRRVFESGPSDGVVSNSFISGTILAQGLLGRAGRTPPEEDTEIGDPQAFIELLSQWYQKTSLASTELDPSSVNDLHIATSLSLTSSLLALVSSSVDESLHRLTESRRWLATGCRTLHVSALLSFGDACATICERMIEQRRRQESLILIDWMWEMVWRFGVSPTSQFLINTLVAAARYATEADDAEYMGLVGGIVRAAEDRLEITEVDRLRWR